MWDTIKIPGKYQSFRDDTDFALFIKWFEVFAEDTIFETNPFRKTILSETIERLSSLLKIQKKSESKTYEKLLTLSKINNAKRRKIDETLKKIDLPDEIMLKILNYTQTKDVFGSIALVCKRFNNLTKDPNAIKFLHVGKVIEDEHLEKMIEIIQRSRNIREFKMRITPNRKGFYEEKVLQSVLSPNLNVKTLRLCGLTGVKERDYQSLFDSQGTKLEELEIHKHSNQISGLTNLKSLKIIHDMHKSKCTHLVQIARYCQSLERIEFRQMDDPHDYLNYRRGICALARGFHEFFSLRKDSLKSITIEKYDGRSDRDRGRGDRFGGTGVSFLKNMSLCKDLEEIRILDASFLLDKSLDIISKLPKLKILQLENLGNLTNWELDYYGMKSYTLQEKPQNIGLLFRKLETYELKLLSISQCEIIKEEDIETLATKGCPKLEKLVLDKCPNLKIKDSTLKTLIKNCPSLQSLQLHWRMIKEISTNVWNELKKQVIIYITLGKSRIAIEDFVWTNAN